MQSVAGGGIFVSWIERNRASASPRPSFVQVTRVESFAPSQIRRATPEETRAEVRRCFREAGAGGGLILSPSDHFFEAKPELLHAFADEARKCTY